MGEQATLADVAVLAGVSLATASRALSPSKGPKVGSELRARVRAAAAELSYVPNVHAQAMRSAVTSVGLIVHDIADPVSSSLAAGVLSAAGRLGVLVTLGASGGDPEAEVRLVEAQRRNRSKGVILAGSRFVDSSAQAWLIDEITAIQASGARVVTVGQPEPPADSITVDERGGARNLASTLCDLGFRRYAVLAGPENLQASEQRVAGFREGLADHGVWLDENWAIASQFSRDGGYSAMRELLDADLDADCVFAIDDSMAMGAMAAVRDSGLQVPNSIAVAGFGDIPALRDVVPGLTTVRLPLQGLGKLAFELALSRTTQPQHHTVSGTVVVRASTPRPHRPH